MRVAAFLCVGESRRLACLLAAVCGIAACPTTVWAKEGVASTSMPKVATTYAARVSRVFDGDTLWVKPLDGGRDRKLRIDGIDAPEICQAGGIASRDALAQRVLGQVVTVGVRRYDDYARGLAVLSHQGDDVAGWLVREGQAWSYRWRRSLGPYANEEAQARAARKGLFADAAPELPRAFRQRHGPCPMP